MVRQKIKPIMHIVVIDDRYCHPECKYNETTDYFKEGCEKTKEQYVSEGYCSLFRKNLRVLGPGSERHKSCIIAEKMLN